MTITSSDLHKLRFFLHRLSKCIISILEDSELKATHKQKESNVLFNLNPPIHS